jgi:hypothetical protein
LTRENVVTLEKMLAGAGDKCYYCGSTDHYINACPQKNIRRITKKRKELKIKNTPKLKIMKYYGMTKLLQNSNLDTSEILPEKNENNACKYCSKTFESNTKLKYHENMTCKKNIHVEIKKKIDADVDAILEKNKKYIDKKK